MFKRLLTLIFVLGASIWAIGAGLQGEVIPKDVATNLDTARALSPKLLNPTLSDTLHLVGDVDHDGIQDAIAVIRSWDQRTTSGYCGLLLSGSLRTRWKISPKDSMGFGESFLLIGDRDGDGIRDFILASIGASDGLNWNPNSIIMSIRSTTTGLELGSISVALDHSPRVLDLYLDPNGNDVFASWRGPDGRTRLSGINLETGVSRNVTVALESGSGIVLLGVGFSPLDADVVGLLGVAISDNGSALVTIDLMTGLELSSTEMSEGAKGALVESFTAVWNGRRLAHIVYRYSEEPLNPKKKGIGWSTISGEPNHAWSDGDVKYAPNAIGENGEQFLYVPNGSLSGSYISIGVLPMYGAAGMLSWHDAEKESTSRVDGAEEFELGLLQDVVSPIFSAPCSHGPEGAHAWVYRKGHIGEPGFGVISCRLSNQMEYIVDLNALNKTTYLR